MSSSPKLTTTQNFILTTIAWRGPCTPYELKDYFQRVVRVMVEVPHTLLYTEPPKLAAFGLVDEQQESTGRRRKTYTITDAGMAVVREWLATPPEQEPSLADLAIAKLAWSALSTPSAVRDLARHQITYYEQRIAMLEAGLVSSDPYAHERRYIRTGARLALRQAHVLLEFWHDVEQDPDRKAESKRRGTAV